MRPVAVPFLSLYIIPQKRAAEHPLCRQNGGSGGGWGTVFDRPRAIYYNSMVYTLP